MTSRIYWSGVAHDATTTSIGVGDDALRTNKSSWHVFVSGTLGTGVTGIQLEYSPDTREVADGSSRWFAPTALLMTGLADTWFQAQPRKFRVIVTGGNGSTSLTIEVR